ncbi:hypothetical protein RA27_00395 [Ruegeria sp. ANG-R]|nr:hypothetical protein RA27_00395 [Ruegeria sp. ANG-R]
MAQFTVAHNDAADIDQLERLIADRTEATMFKLARVEYQHALYSASFAQYRQAHISLRLFFELSLCCILFSAHEIDIRLWLKDQKDSNWQSIINEQNGVFSKHFVGAFFEEMKEHCDQYRSLAKTLYRECSEFVHGNRQSYEGIDTEISYNPDVLEAWADRADTARLIVKFAFICRHLRDASAEVKNELEDLVLEGFGDLAPIQAIFED